jgi:hypothetical protein
MVDDIVVTNEQEQQFLYLDTKGWKTGRQHRIEIWFVSYAGKFYVISERKEKAHWVQNIMHNPRAMFNVTPNHSKVLYEYLTEAVSSLMDTKYGWSDGLIVELTPYKEQRTN